MTGVERSKPLRKAELHLFTEKSRSSFPLKGSKHLRIYTNGKNGTTQNLIRIKKVPRNLIGYVKVDITNALSAWMNDSTQNNTFRIEAAQSNKEKLSHIHLRKRRSLSESVWFKKKPILFLYMGGIQSRTGQRRMAGVEKKRKRRSNDNDMDRIRRSNDIDIERIKQLKETHEKAQKETCRLRPYYLDFVKLEWNTWIIAPPGYKVNYCLGECPRPLGRYYNTTNHAVIQNSVLRLNRKLVPPLCCIPTGLRDQTFLYMNNFEKLLLKNPSEMVATGCGCH